MSEERIAKLRRRIDNLERNRRYADGRGGSDDNEIRRLTAELQKLLSTGSKVRQIYTPIDVINNPSESLQKSLAEIERVFGRRKQ